MIKCLWIGAGGFLGAVCRYLLGQAVSASIKHPFPFSTLLINFIGALLMGLITEFSFKIAPIPANIIAFLTVGILGGFTTFSTFSLETVNLMESGRVMLSLMNAVASVVLCIAGVYLGKLLIRTAVKIL